MPVRRRSCWYSGAQASFAVVQDHAGLALLVLVGIDAEDAVGEVAGGEDERRARPHGLLALLVGFGLQGHEAAGHLFHRLGAGEPGG
ncbi:MAG TPA: hypothetical protein VM324_01560, partial [Egibacteraceae bacterium]|nr:hypothetical protein [Egibacteraceae bacterium]